MPLRHVVMLKFKDDATEEAKARVLTEFTAIVDLIPEIKGFKAGYDAGLSSGNNDFVAMVDFDTPLDYQTYATVLRENSL